MNIFYGKCSIVDRCSVSVNMVGIGVNIEDKRANVLTRPRSIFFRALKNVFSLGCSRPAAPIFPLACIYAYFCNGRDSDPRKRSKHLISFASPFVPLLKTSHRQIISYIVPLLSFLFVASAYTLFRGIVRV